MDQQSNYILTDKEIPAPDADMVQEVIGSQNVLTKKKYRSKLLRRPILSSLQKLMVAYLVVWSISPPLSIDMIYRYAALGCAGGWLIIEMSRRRKFEKIHGMAIVFMLAVIAVALVESEGEFSAVLKQISYYLLVIGFLMNYVYRDKWDEFKRLVPLVLILWIVFNIITAKEVIADPTVARKIVRADDEMIPYLRRGVGGYALVYSQVFLFPVMLAWIKNAFFRAKPLFVIGLVWAGSYTVLILNAGYSIALITAIASSLILLFYKKKSVIPAVAITLSLIVLLVLIIGYVDSIREALLEFFDGTAVAKKINDIYDSVHGIETADSIQERMNRYADSFNVMVDYPIIGGLCWGSGGGHSSLLDTFAKYGVFGGYMYCRMFYIVPVQLKKREGHKDDLRISNAFLSSLFIVTLLDSLPYEMIFPVMIVSPALISNIDIWRKEREINYSENALDSQPDPGERVGQA